MSLGSFLYPFHALYANENLGKHVHLESLNTSMEAMIGYENHLLFETP